MDSTITRTTLTTMARKPTTCTTTISFFDHRAKSALNRVPGSSIVFTFCLTVTGVSLSLVQMPFSHSPSSSSYR